MGRKIIFVIAFGLMASLSFAEVIYFKDGQVVESDIIRRSSYFIVAKDAKGFPVKYFLDEIDRIEDKASTKVETEAVSEILVDTSEFEYIAESKVRMIIRLMEINGTISRIEKNIQKVIDGAPEDRKKEIQDFFDLNDIIKILVPVYDRHYFEEDLRQIIVFYESPAGKKFLEATPKIMTESMRASVQYFQEQTNR